MVAGNRIGSGGLCLLATNCSVFFAGESGGDDGVDSGDDGGAEGECWWSSVMVLAAREEERERASGLAFFRERDEQK